MTQPPFRTLLPLLFLLLLSSRLPDVHAAFNFTSPRVSSGLVALYTFTEGASSPSSLQSADQSGVNALGNVTLSSDPLSAAWTSGRAGLHLNGSGSQTRAASTANVAHLLTMLTAAAGLTVELWFTPANAAQSGMVVGLGNWAPKAQESDACGDYDLAIYQQGSGVFVEALLSTGHCPSTTLSIAFTSPTYLSITLNSSSQLIALNSAAPVVRSVTTLDFTTWLSSMFLMFGQTKLNVGTTTWAGDVFLFAVYNRSLTAAELQQNYAAGLPFSIPSPAPAVAWLNIEQGSAAVAISSLSSSTLTMTYTNTDSASHSTITIAITAPPAWGFLYTSDLLTQIGGSFGASVPFSFTVGDDFAYQPPPVFSGVDSFTFAASTSIGSGPNGVVNILVIAPPSSSDLAASTVVSTQVTVTLSATDSNTFAYSGALGFTVFSLPASGQLYQTSDGVTQGAAISSSPTLVTSAGFSVIYLNTAGSTPAEGGVAVLYTDAFQFKAQVTYNGTVVVADQPNTATVSITNSMVAYNGGSSWSYTPLNSSTLVLLTLNGSNLLGGSATFIVQQLPLYVSSLLTLAVASSSCNSLAHFLCVCIAQGALFSTSSADSAVASAGFSLPSAVVYYAPIPYLYSNLPYPTVLPIVDSFLFATQDGTGLTSSSADYSLALSLSTVPYPQCVSLASSYPRQSFSNRTCDDSLLFLYTFEEGQLNSSAVQTADVSCQQLLGPLFLNGSLGVCVMWNTGQAGITFSGTCQTPISSRGGLSPLIQTLSTSRFFGSFTLELWVQPTSDAQYASIAAFGPPTVVTEGQEQVDVAFKQSATYFEADVDGVGSGNLQVLSMYSTALPLHHVVLEVQGASLGVIFLDGQVSGTTSSTGYSSYVSSWSPADHLIFANSRDASSTNTWQGVVSLVAMYSRALTASEVLANYQAGLPNNLPVPTLIIQHVLVNASVNCSLSSLQLGATDVDQQFVTQQPYSTWLQPQAITLYITALPVSSKGNASIAYTSGAPTVTLTAAMLPFALPSSAATYSLWFLSGALSASQLLLPAYSVISSFASFQVTPHDGIAYGPPATVFVDVFIRPMMCNSSSSVSSSNTTAVFFQFASPRVSSGLLSLYTFAEGASSPSSLQSADQSGVNALGNITLSCDLLSAAWANGRAGLHLNGTGGQTRAVSASNVTQLVSLLGTSRAYTFDLWFTPSNGTQGMIFGLGSWAPKQTDYTGCYSGPLVQYNVAVYQLSSAAVSVSIAGGSFFAPQCSALSVSPSPRSTPYHLAITANSTKVIAYLNSAATVLATTGLNLSVWTSTMQLFFGQTTTASSSTSSWAGDVFLFSAYNRSLSAAEVQQNYAAGLPHSVPVALPASTWLVMAFSPVSVDLYTLSPALSNFSYSNFDISANANVSIYITKTPSNGTLSAVASGPQLVTPYKYTTGQSFWYRSTGGFHGVDQFLFKANISGITGSAAAVNILVVAPPTSSIASTSALALNSTVITLSGSDPNTGLGVISTLSMWILSLPSAGQLYQTVDGVTAGQQIMASSLPVLVVNAQFSVIYVNTFASLSFNGLARLNDDSFSYQPRVVYNQSTFGLTYDYVVSISLLNPMSATSNTSQGSYTSLNVSTLLPIQLTGVNANGGSIAFAISQLPISGSLYSTTSPSSLLSIVGAVLPSSVVYYAPQPYPFSGSLLPVVFNTQDSFQFTVQDSNGIISPPATETITLSLSTVPYPQCVSLASTYTGQSFINRACDDSLLFLYTFEEGQLNSSAVQTADVSWQQLLGPLSMPVTASRPSQWLSGQAGVRLNGASAVVAAASVNTATSAYEQISAQHHPSFCLEGWVQQDDSASTQYSAVFGFSFSTAVPQTTTTCSNSMDMAMTQAQSAVVARTKISGACNANSAPLGSGLHHVVSCVDGASARSSIYVDASLVASSSIAAGYAAAAWNGSAQLMLAPESDYLNSSYPTWQGVVSLVAMYSRALTASEVLANYQAGLPNNLPVPTLLTQHVLVNDSINSSLTAAALQLGATDVDQQLITQQPYSTWLHPQVITLYVTSVPTPLKGNLSIAYTGGAPTVTLTAAMLPFALPSSAATFSLWFISGALSASQLLLPAYSVISSFASFQVTPHDGIAYGPPATVYVDVATPLPLLYSSSSSTAAAQSSSDSSSISSSQGSSSISSSAVSSSLQSSSPISSSIPSSSIVSSSIVSSSLPSSMASSSESSSISWPSSSADSGATSSVMSSSLLSSTLMSSSLISSSASSATSSSPPSSSMTSAQSSSPLPSSAVTSAAASSSADSSSPSTSSSPASSSLPSSSTWSSSVSSSLMSSSVLNTSPASSAAACSSLSSSPFSSSPVSTAASSSALPLSTTSSLSSSLASTGVPSSTPSSLVTSDSGPLSSIVSSTSSQPPSSSLPMTAMPDTSRSVSSSVGSSSGPTPSSSSSTIAPADLPSGLTSAGSSSISALVTPSPTPTPASSSPSSLSSLMQSSSSPTPSNDCPDFPSSCFITLPPGCYSPSTNVSANSLASSSPSLKASNAPPAFSPPTTHATT